MGKHTRSLPRLWFPTLEKRYHHYDSLLATALCDQNIDKSSQDQRETLTHGNRSRHPWTLRSTCRTKFALGYLDVDDRGDIDCVKWPHWITSAITSGDILLQPAARPWKLTTGICHLNICVRYATHESSQISTKLPDFACETIKPRNRGKESKTQRGQSVYHKSR